MKYRLGLDLGVSSIGSSIITLNIDNEAADILAAAVRIFPVSEGAEDRRMKRQMRKNTERTKQRLKLLATALYEKGFWPSVTPETPEGKQNEPPYNLCPYGRRAHAIHGKLNDPYELGRILLHMAKHRGAGFIEAMTNADEEAPAEDESKKKKEREPSSYELLPKLIKESGAKTVGEYFHLRLKRLSGQGKNVRQRTKSLVKEKPVDYAIPRYLLKDEFHCIWDNQSRHYPALADEAFKKRVYEVLFYERPSAPFATANCVYINGENRLLKAHPLSEKRRIYEAANNIRLLTDDGSRKLTKVERDKIIDNILMKGKNANKTSVRETLGFDKKIDIKFADKESGIKPYLYSKEEFTQLPAFAEMTEERLIQLAEFMAEPVIPGDKQGRLYREDDLVTQLKGRLNINDEKQIGDLIAKLPKGRGMLGITATRKILELLKDGISENEPPSHREVTDYLAKNGDVRFKAEEVLAQETQGKYALLPYYGEVLRKDTQPIHPWQKERNKTLNPDEKEYGKIANPAVHRMLNQLRRVVNDIIRCYGKPREINIELGRDVGMSSKKKEQFEKQQNQNKKANDKAVEYLKDKKIKINNDNILKYRLAQEQGWADAFNPQKRIEPRFVGFEIEHLIPQAAGGSDTPANLVLVDRNENAGKSNQYPYKFFQECKTPEQIREILKNARRRFQENKIWRFESDAQERFEDSGDDSATDRYLTDTRYMAKMAARYLRAILDFSPAAGNDVINTRILTVKGMHTARLRTAWNLDALEYELMGLNIPRYIDCPAYWQDEETGEVIAGDQQPDIDGKWKFYDKKKNKEWRKKPRIDHRHHALDAITLGCINRNFSSRLNWADKHGHTLSTKAYPLPLCGMDANDTKAERERFRAKVFGILQSINVSHKTKHPKDKNGELHEGTGKAILTLDEKYKDKTITRYARKVLSVVGSRSDLSKLLINSAIKSEWHTEIAENRTRLEKLKADFEGHYDEAKENLEKRNLALKADGKKGKDISEAMILMEAYRIIKEKDLWKGERFPTYTNEKSLIIVDKHKIAYKSGNNYRVDFYQKNGKVEWQLINNFNANDANFVPECREGGCKPIWSLHQGDLIELDTPESWKHFTNKERCTAEVRNFTDGKMAICYYTDARMTKPPKGSPHYMTIEMISDKGLATYTKSAARKIELTPTGGIKKKHKKLWHGKKAAA